MKSLIVGLGNPGKRYEKTRHNIGFRIVTAFAEKYLFPFSLKEQWRSQLAKGNGPFGSVILMMPLTLMNLSGESVSQALEATQIELSRLLIVVDDVALPFGHLRMRPSGNCGGHNGLRSVEAHLGTQRFPRLRVGIGDPQGRNLADFVLDSFSAEEEKLIPNLLERSIQAIDVWLEKGITRAMDFANRNPSNPSNGE